MDVIAAFLPQRAISVFPYLDDWLIKDLIRKPIDLSDKILHSNHPESRFSSKSKEIGTVSLSEIHVYRNAISDAGKFSQGSNGSCTEPNSDNQIYHIMQTSISTNFPFSFGQTQCYSRFCSPRQTSLTSPANVSVVCLEISYSSSKSSDYDQRYDLISLTTVDEHITI